MAAEKTDASIFTYKKELAITDVQEKNLRSILANLNTYLAEQTKVLDLHRAELNKLIADKADLGLIRLKLRTIAEIQADATCEDIASVRAIENELTPDQLAKWRGMQEEFKKKSIQSQNAVSQ